MMFTKRLIAALLLFSFGLPESFLGSLLFFCSGSKYYFTSEQKDDQFKRHQGRHNTLVGFRCGCELQSVV